MIEYDEVAVKAFVQKEPGSLKYLYKQYLDWQEERATCYDEILDKFMDFPNNRLIVFYLPGENMGGQDEF